MSADPSVLQRGFSGLRRWRPLSRRLRKERRERRARDEAMSRSSDKRWLLGWLAFAVALPFPMNEPQPDGVVSWAGLLLYLAVVSVFLWRVRAGRESGLPVWVMNLLGLAYIPWFLFRLRTLAPVQIARPMVELLLFGLVVKLFSMRREKEKWHVSVLLFFLFVAAMATSVHPLIVLYLMVFLALWIGLLFRFLQLHLEHTFSEGLVGGSPPPTQRFLVSCCLLVVLMAIPFFALMPRLRTPYILGRGVNLSRPGYATGFRDEVNLDVVGNIRQNEAVAVRLKPEDATLKAPRLLRGTTYDRFENNSWRRSRPRLEPLRPSTSNLYRLAETQVAGKMRVWLEPLDSSSLMLPLETATVELSERLYTDAGGGVLLSQPRRGLLEYRVGLADRAIYRAAPPDLGLAEGALDGGGVTPRIRDLGVRVAAGFPPPQAARRIEQYLTHNYEYTLDFMGRDAEQPIEDFLFRYRSGHCEFFATAMILMLRSVDIPARLVTGFMGSEFNPLEDFYIVRQNNAHAWVEAYLPESGWTTFDPTPAAGRPSVSEPSVGLVLRQAWDYVEFRWDRYVMSYGFFDQVGLLLQLRDVWRRIGSSWKREAPDVSPVGETAERDAPGGWQGVSSDYLQALRLLGLGVLAVLLSTLVVWAVIRYRSFDAARAYRLLRGSFARRAETIGAATAPLALQSWVESNVPQASESAGQVIRLYLLESYGGQQLERGAVGTLRRSLRDARSQLRRWRPDRVRAGESAGTAGTAQLSGVAGRLVRRAQ
jgi:transglutaminase-like putative cysteine protease